MIYVVVYSYLDDYWIIGASVDKKRAKKLERESGEDLRYVSIIETTDGKEYDPWGDGP